MRDAEVIAAADERKVAIVFAALGTLGINRIGAPSVEQPVDEPALPDENGGDAGPSEPFAKPSSPA